MNNNSEFKIDYENLIIAAIKARKKSYCKYSGFAVGASLLTEEGKIFDGCNIENSAFVPSICAERVAFYKAISFDSENVGKFKAIAIVGGKIEDSKLDFCSPCGVCRQVMNEFCKEDFEIILAKVDNDAIIEHKKYYLKDLFPLGFNNLK